MKRMAVYYEIAKIALLLLIVIAVFVKKRNSSTPHDVKYRYELQDAAFTNTSNYAIVITNAANKVVLWNVGAEKLFGYKASEAIGKDLAFIGVSLPDFILKNTPVDTEAKRLTAATPPTESKVPISLTVSECKVGTAVHYAAYMKSIWERKEREMLQERELKLLNEGEEIGAFGSWSWAINAPELETDMVLVTEGFNRIFETDDQVSSLQELMDRVWYEDQPRVFAQLRKAQEEKSDYEIEYRIQRRNGKIIWLMAKGKVYLTVNGNISKIVGTVQKIKKDV